jgi:hypothetical protein
MSSIFFSLGKKVSEVCHETPCADADVMTDY